MDIQWKKLTILQKRQMIINYINNELEKNKEDYQNSVIDNLTYTKNNLFLESLKKDKIFFANIMCIVILYNYLIYISLKPFSFK